MNIQIFGTKKSSDTRKTERFFKERGIKFQSIDLKEKGLSKGEFNSVTGIKTCWLWLLISQRMNVRKR